jgi:hypothetical protein
MIRPIALQIVRVVVFDEGKSHGQHDGGSGEGARTGAEGAETQLDTRDSQVSPWGMLQGQI